MLTYLEKLQQKPEHHRRRIVAITSGLITAIIALFWVGSFFVPGQKSDTTAESGTSPVSIIQSNLGSAYDSLQNGDTSTVVPLVPTTSTDGSVQSANTDTTNYNTDPTTTNDPVVTPADSTSQPADYQAAYGTAGQ